MVVVSTTLRSLLFRGDQRLAAALADDQHHITPGSVGPHVSKIQCAVVMLDGGLIPGIELLNRRYGENTAKAVLAYKRRRKIINPAYQTQADNIVGKMTMRTLDDEMFLAELADFPKRVPA